MRAPAPRCFLACALRLVFLVDRKRDAPAADAIRHRHHGMGRLRKQRMVIVAAGTFRPAEVGHVDDPEAAVPAARPHLVAESQRMVEPVPAAGPGRGLAALDMLPGHPPAGEFPRLARIAQIVDDEDVADIAFHLGRDVGVALIHVEAVHADPAGLLIADELRLRRFGDVVDLEATAVIAALLEFLERAQIVLGHAHPRGDFRPCGLALELLGERCAAPPAAARHGARSCSCCARD